MISFSSAKNYYYPVLLALFFFVFYSAAAADPGISAKWYDTGSAAGSYTELTSTGSAASPWDYNKPNRYLEISLTDLDPAKQYDIKVTVPTGIQFIYNGAWSTPAQTYELSSTIFTPLGDDNGYSNNLTGTLIHNGIWHHRSYIICYHQI